MTNAHPDPLNDATSLDPLVVAAVADPDDAPYGESSREKSTTTRVRLSAVISAARAVAAMAITEATGRYNLTGYIDAADALAAALARADKEVP